MTKNKAKKISQVPIADDLLKRIYITTGFVAENRAKEFDRIYVEGHRSQPEDLDWAASSAKLLSKRLPKDKW